MLREQVKAGVIEDISDAVNAGGWKDRFSPSALNLYAVDGRTYGVPMPTSRYWGVVLPQVAFGLTAAIVLIRNYFKGLPADLFEATPDDGCGYFSFFRLIVLPLSRPILATVAVITFAHS